jgi:hypothetical protein
LTLEPRSQDLDEEDVAESSDDQIGAGTAICRFALHLPQQHCKLNRAWRVGGRHVEQDWQLR